MLFVAGQAVQRARNVSWREFASFINGQSDDHLCQRRACGDARRTALGFETRLDNFTAVHFEEKTQQVAADWIGRIAASRRVVHFADVAGVFQMF